MGYINDYFTYSLSCCVLYFQNFCSSTHPPLCSRCWFRPLPLCMITRSQIPWAYPRPHHRPQTPRYIRPMLWAPGMTPVELHLIKELWVLERTSTRATKSIRASRVSSKFTGLKVYTLYYRALARQSNYHLGNCWWERL